MDTAGWQHNNYPHVVTLTYVYTLPFGRGQKFANSISSVNTVHLTILIAFRMLIGGRGILFRGRRGKLLILRLTPRKLRRLRLETTRSSSISRSTAL